MSEIVGIARFKFHEGKVEEFKRLSAQCMEVVKSRDPGTLEYSTYFNEDQSEAIVIERYKDSASALQHFANMSPFMEQIMATASIYGELLGDPNDEIRANLKDGPVRLFTPYMTL